MKSRSFGRHKHAAALNNDDDSSTIKSYWKRRNDYLSFTERLISIWKKTEMAELLSLEGGQTHYAHRSGKSELNTKMMVMLRLLACYGPASAP